MLENLTPGGERGGVAADPTLGRVGACGKLALLHAPAPVGSLPDAQLEEAWRRMAVARARESGHASLPDQQRRLGATLLRRGRRRAEALELLRAAQAAGDVQARYLLVELTEPARLRELLREAATRGELEGTSMWASRLLREARPDPRDLDEVEEALRRLERASGDEGSKQLRDLRRRITELRQR
ncbi:MAG: hypothetical protein AB7N76_34100 [Planctomycetota bacterium]